MRLGKLFTYHLGVFKVSHQILSPSVPRLPDRCWGPWRRHSCCSSRLKEEGDEKGGDAGEPGEGDREEGLISGKQRRPAGKSNVSLVT